MGIVAEGETVVAYIFCRVYRFGQGAQGKGLDDVLLLLAGHIIHKLVHGGGEALYIFGVKLISKPLDEISK